MIDFIVCQLPFEDKVGEVGLINIGGKESFSVLEMAKLIQLRCENVLGYCFVMFNSLVLMFSNYSRYL